MDISTVIAISGTFLKTTGEILAELKRMEIADIDVDLLKLKRNILDEKLADFKNNLEDAVRREKANVEQDLISRGLSSSTILDSFRFKVEQDASTELHRATREYNRAIEEIALMERKVKELSRPPWVRIFRCLFRLR